MEVDSRRGLRGGEGSYRGRVLLRRGFDREGDSWGGGFVLRRTNQRREIARRGNCLLGICWGRMIYEGSYFLLCGFVKYADL